MHAKKYDYIITGAGCAGLSLAMHMINSGKLGNKKVLLVDEATKEQNDRTWCFWETGESIFEPVVFRQWEKLWILSEDLSRELNILPYRYKMICGIDFYSYCFDHLKQHPNFQFVQGKVERVFSEKDTGAIVNGETLYSDYVFNSILFDKPVLSKKQHWLLQHFKGWQIQSKENVFDCHTATLMDFRISQKHGTAFCYVLPFSEKEALVEFTLFTPSVLHQEQYDEALKYYIERVLNISSYKITSTEFGVIPMTNYPFERSHNNIIHMGTAGGQTKGSSGYTFYFIQKHSRAIVNALLNNVPPVIANHPRRFTFYDSVLLHILKNNTVPGKKIFSTLFQKNKAPDVLTFLNNESTLQQELKIIASLPTFPFLKAAIKQIF